MITSFEAIILGIVEGITEFLPISSTAHLILTSHLLGIPQSNFAKTFEIAIQSGAILAVLYLYFKDFLNPNILKKIIIAFIPTGVLGVVFYGIIKNYLLESTSLILSTLALGGIFLILFEYFFREKEGSELHDITYSQAFFIGIAQSVAMVPGVSRAAATILGGLALGIKRKAIVEFSFLLAVPTMLVATGFDLMQNAGTFTPEEFNSLGIGFIVSFITAVLSIKFLLHYIRRHSFVAFGVYRILLVALFFLFFL